MSTRLLPPSCTLGAVLLLLGGPHAQHVAQRHPDGSWTETAARANGDGLRASETALRSTSLMLLGVVATTRPRRHGLDRDWGHPALRWLLGKIDRRGRIALRTDRHWLRDHSLGCYALVEAMALTDMKPLFPRVLPALQALTRHLQRRRLQVDPETLFWTFLTCRRLERLPAGWAKMLGDHGADLQQALRARLPEIQKTGSDGGEVRPFALYLQLLQGTTRPEAPARLAASRLAPLNEAFEEQSLGPRDVAIGTAIAYALGGGRWKAWSRELASRWQGWGLTLYHAKAKNGKIDFGDRDEFQPANLEDLLWRVLTVQIYYRHSRLSLGWASPLKAAPKRTGR